MKGSTIIMLMIASVSASRFGLEEEFARTEGHSLSDFQRRRTVSSDDRSGNALADSELIKTRLEGPIAVAGETLPRMYDPNALDATDHYTQETLLQARALIPARVVAAIGVTTLLAGAGLGYSLCLALHHSRSSSRRSVPLDRKSEAAPLVTVDTDAQAKTKARSPLFTPAETMMVDVKARDKLSSIAKVLLALPLGGGAIGLGYYVGIKIYKPHHHDDHTPQGP
ncbi:hypothetical protein CF327_g1288 [Tilletia walkeri]|uniref:Uncharacterized protein n=1 Tax=Tilletia walkeri TaxID=117179 RepID=A0A8X7NCB5_9BASI|nr:hypothetical protein CF327_g1288 [Tilletia walkeri]KAE8229647.1 hypothetical protein CF326_g5379 [Tilletia indica]KAE8270317.1 hypothetical protein A4X09_0g2037 [Tilletia walkeri]